MLRSLRLSRVGFFSRMTTGGRGFPSYLTGEG